MSKKIIIVTEYFYPGNRPDSYYLTEISRTIIENRNTNVKIICTSELKNNDELEFVKEKITRLKEVDLDKNKSIQRIIKFLIVTFKLAWTSFKLINKGDKVFSVTNPAFLPIVLALLKKVKKFEYTLLVYDIFPENLVAANYLSKKNILYKITKSIFDWAYRQCDLLIVIGRDMEELVNNKTNNSVLTKLITNWCDIKTINIMKKNENEIIKKFDLQNNIVFSFVGNLGKAQGIEKLLESMNFVKNKNVKLLFIGDGLLRETIEQYIKKNTNNNIIYAGSYPSEKRNLFLNACDISIVSLTDGMLGLGVPSKSYYNMAAAKPILFIGDSSSEIAKVITENDIGWVCKSNVNDIANYIDKICTEVDSFLIKGNKARDVVTQNYSKEVILEKYKCLYI